MGLVKSKSPVDGRVESSEDSTQDGSLKHRRCPRPRRRLPPTPSPWTSGELVDSSPENQAELMSALRSKWSEAVRDRLMGQRRGMLKKLVGRLSQKINPEVDTTKPPAHTELRGCCDHKSGATSYSSAGLVTSSTYPVYDANCHGLPVCYHHPDPRTTLTIYRTTLQSCAETAPANELTNNNHKPVESIYHKSNQVCIFTL